MSETCNKLIFNGVKCNKYINKVVIISKKY